MDSKPFQRHSREENDALFSKFTEFIFHDDNLYAIRASKRNCTQCEMILSISMLNKATRMGFSLKLEHYNSNDELGSNRKILAQIGNKMNIFILIINYPSANLTQVPRNGEPNKNQTFTR